MNEMQVFQNSEFGELGVLEVNGKPYFPATACAKILGYAKPHNAIAQHCRYSLKQGVPHPQNPGKVIEMNFIPEGDLYRLITHSKLPAAERFEKWVFDKVLPSIRQTGGYGSQAAGLTKLAEQMTQAATAMVQVVSAMTTVVDKLTGLVDRMSGSPITLEAEQDCTRPAYYGPARCKLESFPKELVRQVEGMLAQMKEQQNLNFSMIARFCTVNGHAISSPAVKTYYQKYFNED